MLAASLVATRLYDAASSHLDANPLLCMALQVVGFWTVAVSLVLGVACA